VSVLAQRKGLIQRFTKELSKYPLPSPAIKFLC